MKKIIKFSVTVVLLVSVFGCFKIFAYWNHFLSAHVQLTSSVVISEFEYGQTPCQIAGLVIDNEFYQQYMMFENGVWTWKRDEYNHIVNASEIKDLTYKNLIIKADTCYQVLSNHYNLIDHGLPNLENPISWALRPVKLDYFEGWAYRENCVVKAEENYYFARYYTTGNPSVDRTGWDKIEPVTQTDFYFYPDSCAPDYSKPKLETIVRSYEYDYFTNYLVGDIVLFENKEYIAIRQSLGYDPQNSWAWEEK